MSPLTIAALAEGDVLYDLISALFFNYSRLFDRLLGASVV